jgi:DNA-binding CsgD family transcriptional regulator
MEQEVSGVPDLLERDSELAFVERLIGDAEKGAGRIAVIEGSAGMGKTTMLAAARERATAAGMHVLLARGGELEAELAFGVVRQLFEGVLARASEEERAELLAGAARLSAPALLLESSTTTDPSAALHGLYWLCANLAERAPVALVVDDAHWADADSLRWLNYLARRIEALPVLVLLALRSHEPGRDSPILQLLTGEPTVQLRALAPLTEPATAQLIKRRLGRAADRAFSRACHEATGGNPFYLGELLTMIHDERLKPTTENAHRVPKLAPATVARAILLRLGRLGKDAVALARAVAVLGPDAELRHAAELAELDVERAQLAADRLSTAELLRQPAPLAFTHPIVAASIAGDIEPGARSIAHKRAAQQLDAHGTPPDRAAVHLLSTAPEGDPWVVERLGAAAAWSLERSAPDAAARFLGRALAEPPSDERRSDVLFGLGRVERLVGSDKALGHLSEAVEATDDLHRQAERTIELASALQLAGRAVEAVAACDHALGALAGGDRDLELRLEAARCRAAIQDPVTADSVEGFGDRFRASLRGKTSAEREVLVELAHCALARGGTVTEFGETMAPLLADGRLVVDHGGDASVVYVAINGLTYADRLDEADELIAQALADVRRRGSLTGYIHISTFRAQARLRRGLVSEAEADARGALEPASLSGGYVVPGTFALLVEALIERDDLEAANAELRRSGLPDPPPIFFPFTMLLHSRAVLRLAQGRAREALADALLCGEHQEALRIRSPALIPWRSTAALAHAALGEREIARRLAAAELERARTVRARRATGIALRAAGVIEPARRGCPLLEEAVAVLSESPARLEYARALVDLGRALRQIGDRRTARARLRDGLDIAYHCGAVTLVRSAREELAVAGARPRRDALRGRDALTASELRIARMAATAMTNREIAQALFVTTKTVETHLRHAFEKLDVKSRRDLGVALEAARPHARFGRPAQKDQGLLPDAERLRRA